MKQKIVKNCTKNEARSLISRLSQKTIHSANSHGAWIEYNKTTYRILVRYTGVDVITVKKFNKLLSRDERLNYKD